LKTIYLHIGVAKTGTTSIQQFLSCNKQALIALGYNYLHSDDGGLGLGHQHFAKSFIVEYPYFMEPADNPECIKKAIRTEVISSSSNKIVISSENFGLASPEGIKKFFLDIIPDCQFKIILFVRSQDELAESGYNQLVKIKRETRSFHDHFELAYNLGWYDFFALSQKWANTFGGEAIVANVFDASKGQATTQILNSIGIVSDEFHKFNFEKKMTNAAVGYKVLNRYRFLNKIEIENRQKVYADIFEKSKGNDFPALMFDSQDGERYRGRYAASNKAFSAKYLTSEIDNFGGLRYGDHERNTIRTKISNLILPELVST
jgi:hypothetical protein